MKTLLLIAGIFVLMLGGFGNGVVLDYLRDSTIQENPETASARIVSHEEFSKVKYGHETRTYVIKYVFNVDGKEYKDKISLINEYGMEALKAGALEVVYSKTNPSIHVWKTRYKDGRTLSGLMWTFAKLISFALVMAPFSGFVLAWKFGWLKKREPTVETA